MAAILEATARILDRGTRVSTNGIARLAGVSIGSLYEYFPNKDAILDSLLEQHEQEAIARLRHELAALDPDRTPLRAGIRRLVDVMLELHADRPRVHQVFIESVMRLPGVRRRLQRAEQGIREEVIAWLRRHPQVDVPDVEVAGRMVVQGTDMLVHRWLEDDEGVPASMLAEELTRLWTGYLAHGAPEPS